MIDQCKFDFVKNAYSFTNTNLGYEINKRIDYIGSHPDPLCDVFDNKFLDECISHYTKGVKSFFINGLSQVGASGFFGCLSIVEPLFGIFSLIIGAIGIGNLYKAFSDYKNLNN